MASVTVPAPAGDAAAGAGAIVRKRNLARIAEQTWIWTIVGYSVLRFVVAWGAFSEHGANVWLFGLIDVGTAWPYAKSVAEVCKRAAHAEWSKLPVPLGIALTTFFAPYAYLWFAAGEMPAGVRIGMAICVTVLMLAASLGALSTTRKIRRDAAATATEADIIVLASVNEAAAATVIDLRDPDAKPDLLIDLTGNDVALERPQLQS